MLEIVKTSTTPKENIIKMRDMKPLQVGEIISTPGKYDNNVGELVMRTADEDKHEVMGLSNPQAGMCWTGGTCEVRVRLLNENESVIIRLFNK